MLQNTNHAFWKSKAIVAILAPSPCSSGGEIEVGWYLPAFSDCNLLSHHGEGREGTVKAMGSKDAG